MAGGAVGSSFLRRGIRRDRLTQYPGLHQPKYNTYYIYGNVILLCQGGDEAESSVRCTNLLQQFS